MTYELSLQRAGSRCSVELQSEWESIVLSENYLGALEEHTLVTVTDTKGTILYASQGFIRTSGYSRDELVGQNHRLVNSEYHPKELFAQLWSTALGGRVWRGEVRNRCKDGRFFWCLTTVVPIKDKAGKVETLAAIRTDVTARREVEESLREREARLIQFIEAMNIALMVHSGGKFLYVNRAFETFTGHTREELLKMDFWEFVHPDDQPMIRERGLKRLSGREAPSAYEVKLRTGDAVERWAHVRASLFDLDGKPTAVAALTDATVRRQAETIQRQTQRTLQQILDGDPVATFVIDANHKVTHWNKACALITGFPASEMVGTNLQWKAFYSEERPVMADLMVSGISEVAVDSYYRGKYRPSAVIPDAYEAEDFFPHFGEHGRWLFFTAAPIRDEEGNVIGAIETLQDTSARKCAEEALRQSQAELEVLVARRTCQLEQTKGELEQDIARREAAEQELRNRYLELSELNAKLQDAHQQLLQSEKLASIGQLAAGVAHEINNPIGYVHSNIGSLENYIGDLFSILEAHEEVEKEVVGPALHAVRKLKQELDYQFLKEDIPSLMEESKEGISRVKKIVQDLKDFSRVDSTQDFQWVDLHQGLDSTLNIVHNEIKYKADVIKEYGELPQIECLPSQLNQVFMNLLVNAAHAMGNAHGRIVVRTRQDGDEVLVEVADNGSGIAEENLSKIFDPFFTTKPVGKGTGLGLSLSYGIVKKHNGRIEVSSAVGKGTTFCVAIPIRHVEAEKKNETSIA